MNPLLSRRSIRRFASRPVPPEAIERLIDAGQRAPTAAELCSVLWVRDPDIRARLPYVRSSAPEMLLFMADLRRARRILALSGAEMADPLSWVGIWALLDVGLFMGNVITAAELEGLGSVIMGGMVRALDRLADHLALPRGVVPIAGLALGYPAESPPPRPRLDRNIILHVDRYREADEAELRASCRAHDEALGKESYYHRYGIAGGQGALAETPPPGYGWATHLARKLGLGPDNEESMAAWISAFARQLDKDKITL